MSDKQELRNALTRIEDEARALRNDRVSDAQSAYMLLARLVKIVREEIVQ